MIWRQNPSHFLGRYTNHGIMPGSALTSLGNKDPREHWGKSWATCSQLVRQTLWCRRTAQSISGLYTVISYIMLYTCSCTGSIQIYLIYIQTMEVLRDHVFFRQLEASPLSIPDDSGLMFAEACQVHNFSRKMKSLNAEWAEWVKCRPKKEKIRQMNENLRYYHGL